MTVNKRFIYDMEFVGVQVVWKSDQLIKLMYNGVLIGMIKDFEGLYLDKFFEHLNKHQIWRVTYFVERLLAGSYEDREAIIDFKSPIDEANEIFLTDNERAVLLTIPVGIENRIKLSELARIHNVAERTMKGVLSDLRMKQIPIGSHRTGGGGIFIARHKSELALTIEQYQAQIIKENSVVFSLNHADFDWRNKIVTVKGA